MNYYIDRDHKTSVTRLKWSKAWSKRHVAHEMMLASADASGRILIWNVKSGEMKTQLIEGIVTHLKDLHLGHGHLKGERLYLYIYSP